MRGPVWRTAAPGVRRGRATARIIMGHALACRPAMKTPAYLTRPTVSVAYLQLMVDILAGRGIGAVRLFEGMPEQHRDKLDSAENRAAGRGVDESRLLLQFLEERFKRARVVSNRRASRHGRVPGEGMHLAEE